MKKIIFKYLVINIILAIVVFSVFYFFQWDGDLYNTYGFLAYLIISGSSFLVFLGVFMAYRIGVNKGFIVYLYCALLKNGILLLFCYKFKEIVTGIILYLFFIYAVLMILEVIFILKLNKYEESKKIYT